MPDEREHAARVADWLKRVGDDEGADRLLEAFEEAFSVLWRRAHLTLGDVTLRAIVDRVLYTAAERNPVLATITVNASGLDCRALRERAASLDTDRLAEGIRFVLVEYLTVLGNLTAEILTPALHLELSKLQPDKSDRKRS